MAPTVNTNSLPAATGSATSPVSPTVVAASASSPWTPIVSGAEPKAPSSLSAVASTEKLSESGGDSNAASKKPAAWTKKPILTMTTPSTVNEAADISGAPVFMGDELWPALSESTKASPKLSSIPDAARNFPDFGSAHSLEVTRTELSSSTVPLSVRSPSPATQRSSYKNHHLNSNHGRPARQSSMRRDGNVGNAQANGGSSHQPSQSASDGSYYHRNHNSSKPSPGGASESSGRDNVQNHSPRESGQNNAGGELPYQRSSFRRGNGGGPHPRGDGSHQNYGGRRSDQDRGNHDWSNQRGFNGRDASTQSQVISRGFGSHPPFSNPFFQPPLMRPFMMPDIPHIMCLPPGMHFVAPVPPMYYPAPDPELYSEIMKQINYYFSNENLVKDPFLRKSMDEAGWVKVDVIAKFNKMKSLTMDHYRILDAVKCSTVVEVQADKIRRRDDWKKWLLPASVQFPTVSGVQSPTVRADFSLPAQMQSVALYDKAVDLSSVKGQVDAISSPMLQLPKDEGGSSGC